MIMPPTSVWQTRLTEVLCRVNPSVEARVGDKVKQSNPSVRSPAVPASAGILSSTLHKVTK